MEPRADQRRRPSGGPVQLRMRDGRRTSIATRSCGLVASVLALVLAACSTDDGGSAADTTNSQHTSEVTVPSEGLELQGTLRLPDDAGPHTGIVIANGSGPSSRRGELPGQLGLTLPAPVPVYEQLAEGLRAGGYAVLTFDKRTCGPFNGCADNGYPTPADDLLFDTFVDDLAAVVDHLADRDDIDRVIVAGHSKGGTVAAQLALRRDDLDGLVLLATPAIGVPELLAGQAGTLRDLIAAVGQRGPQAEQAIDELESLAASVSAVAAGELDGPPIGGVSRDFWASRIEAAATSPAAVRDTDVPVLVVGGSNDWNVLPEQLDAWSPVLDDPEDGFVILDDVTHALTRLDADDLAALTPADVGTSVDHRVIDTVTGWLDGVSR